MTWNDRLASARAWLAALRRRVPGLASSTGKLPHTETASTPAPGFHDITVVSTGWVTRRERRAADELDPVQLEEMLRLLDGSSASFRSSLAGLWQVELRWRRFGSSAAVASFLAGSELASLNVLLSGISPEDDTAATRAFSAIAEEAVHRQLTLPDNLGQCPMIVTLRLPNDLAQSGDHDLEAMRLHLAAAFFARCGSLPPTAR